MTILKSLNASLEVLQTELEGLEDQLSTEVCDLDSLEIDPDDYIEQYEYCLDDLGGEFMGMSASYILKERDPIAYCCGLNNFCDSVDITQTQEYKEIQEEIETLESEIEDLETNIESLEEEIEELENEEY